MADGDEKASANLGCDLSLSEVLWSAPFKISGERELQSQPTLVPLVGANDKLQVNHEYDKTNCALTPSQDSSAAVLGRLLKFTIGILNKEKDGNLDEFKHPTEICHHRNSMQLPFDSVEEVNLYAL